jgi:signal transduction histidine kinase
VNRPDRPERWPDLILWLSFAALGLVAIFSSAIVLGLRTGGVGALLGSMVLVAFFATVVGRFAALALALLALALGVMLDWSSTEIHLGRVTLGVFGATVVLLALLVDALTSERRQTASDLERLHDALAELTHSPELGETLDSVVDSATRALGAIAAAVVLVDASVHASRGVPADVVAKVAERAPSGLAGSTSPVGAAFRGASIAMSVDDPALAEWVTDWKADIDALGGRSLAVAPLALSGEPIGILIAVFAESKADRINARMLESFAAQASVVIARSQAYESERKAAARLQEADRLKSEFLGLVSHELRTPLTAAKGFVDTVILQWDRLDDDQRRELLRRASDNADELTRLITQLLDFTRIEGDLPPLHSAPQPLGPIVRQVVDGMGGALADHRIELAVDPALVVDVDADAVAHIVSNIVGNAAKFSPPGTTILVRADAADGEVVVSVEDEGPGVPVADRERVFERFFQVPDERPTSRKGAGLGLAIVRRYVELSGGRIWVDERPSGGAAFHFTLQRAGVEESTSPSGGLTPGAMAPRIDQAVSPN